MYERLDVFLHILCNSRVQEIYDKFTRLARVHLAV